ncbi:Uncharacterized protein QTN25_007650 [Entamoeba marina]
MLPLSPYPNINQSPAPHYQQNDYSNTSQYNDELNNENIKLQREIETLQIQIRKQKVHPISFTPPTVSLEISPKIYRFRHFEIKLIINPSFNIQYTPEEVLSAVSKAKIRKENDMLQPVTTCWCSSNKEIIEIGVSNTSSIGPYSSENGLTYVLDQCRSHCTSSRDHHHSRLVLVVDQLQGFPPIVSNGFELCARIKGAPPEETTPFDKSQIATPIPNQREKHRLDLQYDSVDLYFTSVYIFATSLQPMQASDALQHVIEFMKNVDGYASHHTEDGTGLYVLFFYFTTYQLSCSASTLLKCYISNERQNFMNEDLHLSGKLRLLSVSL